MRAGARAPSLQLVGRPSHEHLDLAILRSRGVQIGGITISLGNIAMAIVAFVICILLARLIATRG